MAETILLEIGIPHTEIATMLYNKGYVYDMDICLPCLSRMIAICVSRFLENWDGKATVKFI